jgi:superoxide dismutase, Cu-Zn family
MRALAAATALSLLGACGGDPSKGDAASATEAMGVARVTPKNGSTVRGIISFTQKGDRVAVAGQFFELLPGPHSLYIHAVGNCGSPNAASAGPVWNVAGGPSGKRSGDLPQIYAGTEGRADFSISVRDLSVGTGQPNDVIGRSVVVHADVDPDPKAEFGVRNGWLACGVIQRSDAKTLRELL